MTTAREKILQKLNPQLLKMTPKLSTENGSFISLDSGDSLAIGAKKLMIRFWKNQDLCEKNKKTSSLNEKELTVTSVKYSEESEICEILSERLKLPCSKNEDENFSERPGKNLQKLKLQLQEKMSAKWEEEYKRRVKENKLNKVLEISKDRKQKILNVDENSDKDFDPEAFSERYDKDNQESSKENSSEDEGCEGDDEDEEEEEEDINGKSANSITEAYDKPIIKEYIKDMDFDDVENYSLPPAYQPGGGLLYGGSELTQYDEDLPKNLLSPTLKLNVPESPRSKSFNDSTPNGKETVIAEELNNSLSVRNRLFSQNPNDSFDLSEAYEFCSGKFPDEPSKSQSGTLVSNTLATNFSDEEDDDNHDDEEEELIEGEEDEMSEIQNKIHDIFDKSEDEFDNNFLKKPKVRKNIILYDDSEDEERSGQSEVEESRETSKILSDDENNGDKKKKKRKNLQFSDEEAENGDCEQENLEGNKKEEHEEERNSEEEEVEGSGEEDVNEKDESSIHYDSEENEIINPKEFFEKEAELSGSEWSGDEDERGLDEFDVEEGDADNLDNDQVRSELEKIHIRQVLNEDAREVRLIQEILFEDGDLHSDGKGRDRKFKWKNLGRTFEENREPEAKEEGGNTSEEEGAEEEQLRKLRHEKELFLMEKKRNGDENSDGEIIEDFQSVKVTSVKNSVKVSGNVVSRTILDYTEIGKQVTLSKTRGSFLTRNEEFLSKLAKVTSSLSDNILGPKHSKNFVFATKSPEKMERNKNAACKRQMDDSETHRRRRDKKFKILPPDVDTGPSILDLLV